MQFYIFCPLFFSGVGLHLSDVSAISDVGLNNDLNVDDTTNMSSWSVAGFPNESTYKNKTISETKLGNSTLGNNSDLTVTSADIFLDNCKVRYTDIPLLSLPLWYFRYFWNLISFYVPTFCW